MGGIGMCIRCSDPKYESELCLYLAESEIGFYAIICKDCADILDYHKANKDFDLLSDEFRVPL